MSTSYDLVEYVHGCFYPRNDELSEEERRQANVRSDITPLSGTERLTTFGIVDDRRAYSHLSRSPKTGYFHLSTVVGGAGGKVTIERFTPESPLAHADVIASSLFMHVLSDILTARQST